MAVAPMTKAHVIIHGEASRDVIKRIYDLGILQAVEIIEDAEKKKQGPLEDLSDDMAYCLSELEGHLREVTRALEILASYDEVKPQIIENFVPIKQRVQRHTVETVRASFDFLGISQQLQELTERRKHLQDQEEWLQGDQTLLQTLTVIPFPLDDLELLTRTNALIGRLRKENKGALLQELSAYETQIYWEDLTEKDQFAYLFLLYLPTTPPGSGAGQKDKIAEILERYGFDPLDLTKYALRIPEEIQRLNRELADDEKQSAQVQNEIRGFLQHKQAFKIIEDHIVNEIERCKNYQNFAETKKVYFVEGWMRQRDKQRLNEGLREFADVTDALYDDAAPNDETVPVILENPWYLQPFETITRMFGMPKYSEPDPTPMLAPFFFVCFGFCLSDAGYGILLSLFMWWLMRKYIFDEGVLRLVRLFFYGGFATFICGAITGGWFGNIIDSLPPAFINAKNALIVINPMTEAIGFLVMTLVIGFIQVCFGIILKLKIHWQQGDKFGALVDEVNWLVLINSLFFLAVVSATGLGAQPIGQAMLTILKFAAIVSAGVRGWYAKRDNPKLHLRILLGIYSLYDLTGILSDVLSYSRLLALGLSSAVIAMVVDTFALMFGKIPGVGLLLGLVVFCVGHVFNLVLSILGSFIHSARLQLLEFFSKFYESGGKKYKPFRFESKYFEIVE
jgi:V/A-type H+-transporting ATPase subunit I